MATKVVITGATGFVGSQLIEDLDDVEIYALVRKGSSANNNLPNEVIQIPTDLSNPEILQQDLESIIYDLTGAVLYHCAAIISARQARYSTYNRINVEATRVLADFAVKRHFSSFVFLSSMGAAGPVGTKEVPMTENSQERPISYYSKSKLKAEQQLIKRLEERVKLVIFRPPNIYGPTMSKKSGSAMLFAGMQKGLFPSLGNGHNILNMMFVKNLTHAMITIPPRVESDYEVFFIRDKEVLTTREFLIEIKSQFNSNTKLLPIPGFLLWLPAKLMDLISMITRWNSGFNSEITIGGTTDRYNMSIDKINTFGYETPYTTSEAIIKTCKAFAE